MQHAIERIGYVLGEEPDRQAPGPPANGTAIHHDHSDLSPQIVHVIFLHAHVLSLKSGSAYKPPASDAPISRGPRANDGRGLFDVTDTLHIRLAATALTDNSSTTTAAAPSNLHTTGTAETS